MAKVRFDKKKDYIKVIAPSALQPLPAGSSKTLKEYNDELVKTGADFLGEAGFKTKFSADLFSTGDEERADNLEFRVKDLLEALYDPEVRIIWASRGGLGSAEICDELSKIEEIEINGPKIIIGYSDITNLLSLAQKLDIAAIHGTVLTQPGEENIKRVLDVLSGKPTKITVRALNDKAKASEAIEGKVIGGNLRMIADMLETKRAYDSKDAIIVLENLDDKTPQYLEQLVKADFFKGAKAVILGDFMPYWGADSASDEELAKIAAEYLGDIPVYSADGIGHGTDNYPFTIGADAKLLGDTLTIESPFEFCG